MNSFARYTIALIVAIIASMAMPLSAKKIYVRGYVYDEEDKMPLVKAAVYDANNEDAGFVMTDEEGWYEILIEADGILRFVYQGKKDAEIPVDNQTTIDVYLTGDVVELQEIQVLGKDGSVGAKIGRAKMKVNGNYVSVSGTVTIVSRDYSASRRVIVQPTFENVTEKYSKYTTPVVIDGSQYHITQDRMLDYKAAKDDPLNKYATVVDDPGRNFVVSYSDSVYVKNPNDGYITYLDVVIEDYNKIIYHKHQKNGEGSINPLRFLQYDADGVELSDSSLYPNSDPKPRDTRGDIDLTFDINKSTLDMTNPKNQASLNALMDILHDIENDPDVTLRSFKIFSTSSPDGNYESNIRLSRQRMKSAMDIITSGLSATTQRYAKFKQDAEVESWYTLVDLLRADSRNDLADQIKAIVDRHGERSFATFSAIRRLPEYKDVLAAEYLPRMRRVNYEFSTVQNRVLTDAEIAELYASEPEKLSKYDYFRLYRNPSLSPQAKEKALRDALKHHSDFAVAANDLAAMLIDRQAPDTTLLKPFLKQRNVRVPVPDDYRYNQAVAYYMLTRYDAADSLANMLPRDNDKYAKIKAFSTLRNGKYELSDRDRAIIYKDSPVNEVLLLLNDGSDISARKKSQELGNSPEELYVKAMCARRLDLWNEAMEYLGQAILLKPELEKIAMIDSDVNDVLKYLQAEDESEDNTNSASN